MGGRFHCKNWDRRSVTIDVLPRYSWLYLVSARSKGCKFELWAGRVVFAPCLPRCALRRLWRIFRKRPRIQRRCGTDREWRYRWRAQHRCWSRWPRHRRRASGRRNQPGWRDRLGWRDWLGRPRCHWGYRKRWHRGHGPACRRRWRLVWNRRGPAASMWNRSGQGHLEPADVSGGHRPLQS